jgi:arsenate reductase
VADPRPTILFLCVHNAGRSQMAAAFARRVGGDGVVIHSAGSEPGDALNASVVAAMAERGIDLSAESPTPLDDAMGRAADVIVTMGCGDSCPVYPGKRYVDWELRDPAGLAVEDVRPIRDDIEARVHLLVDELLHGRPH